MLTADGIETCRRALGGHGFGGGSGLIQLNNDYLSRPTVEGDNWMITQQVATYLIKHMQSAARQPNEACEDQTGARFREFIRNKKRSILGGSFKIYNCDLDLVKSFELRATSMVSESILSH